MDITKISHTLMKNKFRGCLLGSLVGDCLGAPFVGDAYMPSSKIVLQKYFDKLDGPYFPAPIKKSTKNTIMLKCVAQALISDPLKLDPTRLSKLFVKEYFTDPKRGYGKGISTVFHQLLACKFTDPFKPALEQIGSADNGATTRSTPIALLYHDDYDTMIKTTQRVAEITHTHKQGVNAAILYSIIVQQSLLTDPSTPINIEKFLTDLIFKLKDVEIDEEGLGIQNPFPFKDQMEVIQELLKSDSHVTDEQVVEHLGHSVLAIYSIPTAIYCFLRGFADISNVKTSNPFRRTLQYAISLGGDTATIAGLAGGIAGALYGNNSIGQSMLKHCEYSDEILTLADQLYDIKFKK